MSDSFIILLVLAVGIGGLAGVAFLLDKRARKFNAKGSKLPEPGPIGRMLLWIARIIVVLMVLSIFGAFVFRSFLLVQVTAGCLGLYIVNGIIYRVILISGKYRNRK